jgi:hypothetical protein
MSNLLANIFSAADSLKRTLGDALTSPMLAAQQVVGNGIDRRNKQQEDAATSMSKSVLVPEWQKRAAMSRVASNVGTQDSLAGDVLTSIIVPAKSIAPFAVGKAHKLIDAGKIEEAYEKFRMFVDPIDGKLKSVIPDTGRVTGNKLRQAFPGDLVAAPKQADNVMASDMMRTDDLPGELAQLLSQTRVIPGHGSGAYYSPGLSTIGLGLSRTPERAASKLLHESQHAAQTAYGMGKGGSPENFYGNYGEFSTAESLLRNISEDFGSAMGSVRPLDMGTISGMSRSQVLAHPGAVGSLFEMLTAVKQKAHSYYTKLPGEVEARLVQKQFEDGNYSTNPVFLMDTHAADVVHNPGLAPKVDADPITQSIINKVLGKP